MTNHDVPSGEGYRYRLIFASKARRAWLALDGSVRKLLWPLLARRLDEPRVPSAALSGPLAGCYKIKLRKQGIRLIYSIEDNRLIVTVLGIGKRENDESYDETTTVLRRLKRRAQHSRS